MFQMSSHVLFGHLKHKSWAKEGMGVKLSIWPSTTKSQELPRFLCVQVACNIPLESSQQKIQLCLNLISIGGLHIELWAFEIIGVPDVGILRLPLGNPMTKWHLGAGPVARHIIYYKGAGGDFPQVQIVVSFISSCLPMVHACTKMFQLRTNQLVVWFVQVYVNDWIACQSS